MQWSRSTSPLAAYLAASYVLLIIYACLHPLTGWQINGLSPFEYLFEPWPKYLRTEDIVVNILGYVPLGFVLVPALIDRSGRLGAVLLAVLLGALLSFSIETTQNFLPSRVASNLDLGNNILGTLIGALLGAMWGQRLFHRNGWLHRWRSNSIIDGRGGDAGLILAALWILTQLMPDSMLFATGDLRQLLGLNAPLSFDAQRYQLLEAALVAVSMLAVGLLARCMMQRSDVRPVLLLLLLGIAAKTLASWSFFVPGDAMAWLTPGTRMGALAGMALLLVTWPLPPVSRHALAGMALLGATVLANLMPDNPYLLFEQRLLDRGNFLNFHGLTKLIASTWPFIALAYLSGLGLWRGEHLQLADTRRRSV
jgi:VanZ family protein